MSDGLTNMRKRYIARGNILQQNSSVGHKKGVFNSDTGDVMGVKAGKDILYQTFWCRLFRKNVVRVINHGFRVLVGFRKPGVSPFHR
jgi:hypothetical protein